jgi:hypothetical protein
MPLSRRRKALYLFLGIALVLALLAAHMVAELRRGEDIFWLAELWAPAAVLSIGLVTGIEFLMPAKAHSGHGEPVAAVVEPPVLLKPAKTTKKRPVKKAKAA